MSTLSSGGALLYYTDYSSLYVECVYSVHVSCSIEFVIESTSETV